MNTFIGHTEAKLDDKGRLFVPASYRRVLSEGGAKRLVIRQDTLNACLVCYPETVWNEQVAQLNHTLNEWDPQDQLLLMQFVADAELVELDNQGRILLPKRILQALGNSGEMLVVGMMNRFTIWDKATFASKRLSADAFAEQLRLRMARPQNKE